MAFFFPTRGLTIRPWREHDRPALERMATDLDMMRFDRTVSARETVSTRELKPVSIYAMDLKTSQ